LSVCELGRGHDEKCINCFLMHELFQDKIVVFFVKIITERNFLVQWRRQDLARGGAQNDIEIT